MENENFPFYFKPTRAFIKKLLVKNDKVKMVRSIEKQQFIYSFWLVFYQNPNLHQIHNNTKPQGSKYIFCLFRYLINCIYKFIGFYAKMINSAEKSSIYSICFFVDNRV